MLSRKALTTFPPALGAVLVHNARMNDAPHPALLPAGLYDLLPPEAEIEADVGARLMSVLAAHGYERVKPPLAEFEETRLNTAATRRNANATIR